MLFFDDSSYTIPAGVFICNIDLRDGWHILCPSFLFKLDLIEGTLGDQKISRQWLNYIGKINEVRNQPYANKLYIVVKDKSNEYTEYIIEIIMSSLPEEDIGSYLYYTILVLNGRIISESENTKYQLSLLKLDYLPIEHSVLLDHSNTAPINSIFINNGVSMENPNLFYLKSSQKYIRILNDYFWGDPSSKDDLWDYVDISNHLINPKYIRIDKTSNTIKTPFFKINSNYHYYYK